MMFSLGKGRGMLACILGAHEECEMGGGCEGAD